MITTELLQYSNIKHNMIRRERLVFCLTDHFYTRYNRHIYWNRVPFRFSGCFRRPRSSEVSRGEAVSVSASRPQLRPLWSQHLNPPRHPTARARCFLGPVRLSFAITHYVFLFGRSVLFRLSSLSRQLPSCCFPKAEPPTPTWWTVGWRCRNNVSNCRDHRAPCIRFSLPAKHTCEGVMASVSRGRERTMCQGTDSHCPSANKTKWYHYCALHSIYFPLCCLRRLSLLLSDEFAKTWEARDQRLNSRPFLHPRLAFTGW